MDRSRLGAIRAVQHDLREAAQQGGDPCVFVESDGDATEIRGNQAGLLRFAEEVLEAARGENVWIESQEWIVPESSGITIKLDPNPTPEETDGTFLRRAWNHALLGLVLIGGIGIWTVGFARCLWWIEDRVAHLFR